MYMRALYRVVCTMRKAKRVGGEKGEVQGQRKRDLKAFKKFPCVHFGL